MSLTGKTAIVTGGSRGIGRAICLELARRGCNIVLSFAGNTAAADQTVSDCQALGVQALAVQGNVADADAVKALFDAALEKFGAIDILVNNAGITRDNLLMLLKEEDFDAVVDTNLKGAFLCMKAAVRPMMKQRRGRIISLSSVVGVHGNAGQVNYAASKAGVIGLVKSVATGFIDTDMTAVLPDKAKEAILSSIPMARLGAAEDVASAVAFLASDEAGYITGQVLAVDGGMSM